jgi:hypothetical protein
MRIVDVCVVGILPEHNYIFCNNPGDINQDGYMINQLNLIIVIL